jgi:hypothetical protein
MPSLHRRALIVCAALALACGPEPGASTEAASTGASSGGTSGTVPTTTATTGALPVCGGVTLPQGLPSGTATSYWRSVADVNDPVDAVQIYMVADTGVCTDDPAVACPGDGSKALIGYYVVLGPELRVPGVYPISGDSEAGKAWIGALVSDGAGSDCGFEFTTAAADGEVEVLADDGECIAIDVRGVTPFDDKGLMLDPNGSAHAPRCEP